MWKRITTAAFVSVLFVLAAMFSSGSVPASASTSFDRDDKQHGQTFDVQADARTTDVIVEEVAICNVADRVTETVERRQQPEVVRLPDAPTFAIDHVPLS